MMKNLINLRQRNSTKEIFALSFLIFISTDIAAEVSISANLFLGRAFSANIAREMLMTGPTNQDSYDVNGFIVIDGAYQRMWDQNKTQGIGAYPFWSETNKMTVGSNETNSNIDAYQFGLGPVTTTGSITLNPTIYQDGSDFMFYIRSKQYGHTVFAKIKSALSAMVVNPNLTESQAVTPVQYSGGAIYWPTSGGFALPTNADPALSMIQAFGGNLAGQSYQGNFRPMEYGLIDGQISSGAHLSDTEMTIGYQYICSETDNTASLGMRVSAPTGNKPKGVHILEPITGRGGYWGLGFYLAGTYCLWHDEANQSSLKLNFMSDGIHLFNADVIRSYDLIANGHGSKYLLVADYKNGIYQSSIQNLINLSTLESQSSFPFEGDAAVGLTYNRGGFSCDLGYEVWGRTKENLTITESFDNQRYAILGRQVVAVESNGASSTLCQPTATISSSIDALGGADATNANGVAVDATIASNRIGNDSVFNTTITGQYSAVTSKLFTKIGYNWQDCSCSPYINLMGECEWSNISNNALPQWSIALMVGVSL
ncbi:hypothetical protein KBC04_03520 [Candidatus Babeliales bacterium]|nr:hypothetical protein [Candidatus Babeliales bacterium]MBP9843879.1 hypothetical protein [Candidatus Babeliales bacterium]